MTFSNAFSLQKNKGLIFILSAPSGCGKTTLVQKLIEDDPSLVRSVSVNTRPKRPEEIEGVDYIFVSTQQFQQWEHEGLFVETTEIYGSQRGTLKSTLQSNIDKGLDTICALDRIGVEKLKALFKDQVISVFILPPSLQELKNRLVFRNQDSLEEIESRLSQAQSEMVHYQKYDYCVINDTLDLCLQTIKDTITAERSRVRNLCLVQC